MSPAPASDATIRILTGLIGRGIRASRSPRMHEAEGDAQGLRIVYSRFDFAERNDADAALPELLNAIELSGFAGVNVTHPFKQAVIGHLDRLSPEAERVGAVNTIAFRDGVRTGFNTDTSGFARAFNETLGSSTRDRVVQLGAGGAGAAVANALLERGVRCLALHDTDPKRAEALAERLAPHFPDATLEIGADLARDLDAADGIVNATPVGMAAWPGTPVPPQLLRPGLWVADIVYFPLETELLAAAGRSGCRVMDGSGMAVFQAVGAFEIFTGRAADPARMRATFRSFDDPSAPGPR